MLQKLFIAALAALAISSGVEAAMPLSASDFNGFLNEVTTEYQVVGQAVRLAGANGKGGDKPISLYHHIVKTGAGGTAPAGSQKPFEEATQFALCAAYTTAVYADLEQLTQFKLHISKFTAAQKAKLVKIFKMDKDEDASFVANFPSYAPLCASVVKFNGNHTQSSYAETISLYSS